MSEFIGVKEAQEKIFGGIARVTFDEMAKRDDFPKHYLFGGSNRGKRFYKRADLIGYRETSAKVA